MCLDFFGTGGPLWWFAIHALVFLEYSDGPKFHFLSLYAVVIFKMTQNFPWDSDWPSVDWPSLYQLIFMVLTWFKIFRIQFDWQCGPRFLEIPSLRAVTFCLILQYSWIISSTLSFIRLVYCSHWPHEPFFITQTCFPHFLPKLPYLTCNCVYINTFIPIHCLHMAMNVDGRNFLCSQEVSSDIYLNCTSLQLLNLTDTELQVWIAVGSRCIWWRGDTMWLRGTGLSNFLTLIKNITD